MKQKNLPLISVIMPVFNAAAYLKPAVNSILSQSYSNFEYIIVNDCSTDSSLKILRSFRDPRIKIISNSKNLGVAGSLNRALKLAKGKYVARMDADDISHPDRLRKQVEFLELNPNTIACGVQTEIIDGQNQIISTRSFPISSKSCHDYLMLTSPILHPTLMTRASVYKKIGYTAKYKTAEDWDLYFKLLKFGKLANLPDTLYSYRQIFGSNGFKNIKNAFILITKIRLQAIKNGYQPAWLMLLSNLVQALIVFLLPEKLVFRLFSFWRTSKNTTIETLITQPA
jgi:glycosyltransferase involved in cell wall biosynthesis